MKDERKPLTYFTTGHIEALTGLSRETLNKWIKRGIIKPTVRGHGSGRHHAFSVVEVLAICVSREARRRGIAVNAAANICDWIIEQTPQKLRDAFAAGKTHLLVAGDCLVPMLVSPATLAASDELMAYHLTGNAVAIIDLAQSLCKIVDFAQKHAEVPA